MRQILREIERVNVGCVYVFSFIILWVMFNVHVHIMYMYNVHCTYFIRILYILCIFLCVHIILLVFCGHVCVRVGELVENSAQTRFTSCELSIGK